MQTKKAESPDRGDVRRPNNRLLAALPLSDYRRIAADLTTIAVRPRQVLQAAGERVQYVYFPNGGVYSVATVLPDGAMVEAATVGEEGMFAVEAFLHDDAIATGQAFLQVPDTSAIRLGIRPFRREIAARGALYDLVGRYVDVAVAQMMQTIACNALHPVQERCARWLLMTHDRVGQPEFRLSHEFLAMMLGTRRPTVTVAARALQQAGLISYRHSRITVLDRKGLESAACACYAALRAQMDRLAAGCRPELDGNGSVSNRTASRDANT